MKPHPRAFRFLCASLLGLWAMTAPAAIVPVKFSVKPEPSTNITVKFTNPDKFTDIGDGPTAGPKIRQYDLDIIHAFFVKEAPTYVTSSQRLEITFTDIDRVGGFPVDDETRVWSRGYPPTLKFSFRLMDANGKVLKEGTRTLTDLSFDLRQRPNDFIELPVERGLLRDWMKNELSNSPKA